MFFAFSSIRAHIYPNYFLGRGRLFIQIRHHLNFNWTFGTEFVCFNSPRLQSYALSWEQSSEYNGTHFWVEMHRCVPLSCNSLHIYLQISSIEINGTSKLKNRVVMSVCRDETHEIQAITWMLNFPTAFCCLSFLLHVSLTLLSIIFPCMHSTSLWKQLYYNG